MQDKKISYNKEKKTLIVEITNKSDLNGNKEVEKEGKTVNESFKTGTSEYHLKQEINEEGIKDLIEQLESQQKAFKSSVKKAKDTLKFEKEKLKRVEEDLFNIRKAIK
jgi:tRNA U34 5-carboxymethylaminomethyl modifying GTPase MnmE/TrmE